MKVYENSSFGETRTFVVENDQPVQIIIHRDLVLNAGDIVTVKIKAFHPVLKGYFAETDRGDLFIPTDKKLIEGESVTVQVVKEARADKVATAHFPVGNKAESEMKAEEISADQADEWIDMAMARDVRLKDGGFLHIDRTRVCWTIDVDSGESRDSLTEINQCAAPEVVHQIVLKNMGGMILVDFAGSKRGKVAKTLETQMKQAFAGQGDVILHGWTKAGLFEIERKRFRADLWTSCGADNSVHIYYRVRRALDKCRLKRPLLTVSLPVFNLLKKQTIGVKMKPACDAPVSYFTLEEEK